MELLLYLCPKLAATGDELLVKYPQQSSDFMKF